MRDQLDDWEVEGRLGLVVEGVDVSAGPDQDLTTFFFVLNGSGSGECDDVERGVSELISSVGIGLVLGQQFQAIEVSTLGSISDSN